MSTPEMEKLVREAKEMEKRVADLRRKLKTRRFDGAAGEGTAGALVRATVNGEQEVISVNLTPELVAPGQGERLEKLIIEALNNALTTSKQKVDADMKRATHGFPVPGIG